MFYLHYRKLYLVSIQGVRLEPTLAFLKTSYIRIADQKPSLSYRLQGMLFQSLLQPKPKLAKSGLGQLVIQKCKKLFQVQIIMIFLVLIHSKNLQVRIQ